MSRRKKLPKSIRKYIRREKGRLRRQILDFKKQEEKTEAIYRKLGIERETLAKKKAK